MLDRLEGILDVVAGDGVHDVLRELVRARRGDDDHGGGVLLVLGDIVARGVHGARGVRVHRVLVLLEELVDGLHRLVLPAEVRPEQLLHRLALLVVQLVHALGGELFHAHLHALRLPAGELEEQAFEVGGDEDIHRGGHRLIELAALVVHARADKIREDVVLVGGADELADGQPHALGIVCGEDIAEIPGGDVKIYGRAHVDLPGRDEVEIGGKIIGDLRGEPAEVDGVRRGEDVSPALELLLARIAREDALDGGLALVEIAAHGEHVDVAPLLRRHLQLLHFGDAVIGVKDHDLDAGGVLEPLERRLARIAAGGDEDEHLLFYADEVAARAQQIRQQSERHIFKGAGGAVEELEHVQPRVDLDEGGGVSALELRVRLFAGGFEPFVVVFVQKFVEHGGRALGVAHGEHRLQLLCGDGGEALRDEEAAVCGDALGDRLRTCHTFSPARADKFHRLKPRFIYNARVKKTRRNIRPPPFAGKGGEPLCRSFCFCYRYFATKSGSSSLAQLQVT